MRVAEHAPRGRFDLLERIYCLAEIVEVCRFEAAILEFEFLRLLPHVGRDGHRDLLRLAALVARAQACYNAREARYYFTLL